MCAAQCACNLHAFSIWRCQIAIGRWFPILCSAMPASAATTGLAHGPPLTLGT